MPLQDYSTPSHEFLCSSPEINKRIWNAIEQHCIQNYTQNKIEVYQKDSPYKLAETPTVTMRAALSSQVLIIG